MLQSVWYIKNKKGESQGKGKILTKYYSIRRKLIKAGLLNVKTTTFANVQTDSKFVSNCLQSCEKHSTYNFFLHNIAILDAKKQGIM